MKNINDPVGRVLITEEQIKKRIGEMAEQIGEDYAGREPLMLSVLSGSFMFAADMMRAVKIRVCISFIYASSYGEETVSGGEVEIRSGKGFDPKGRDIIIVEDIIDTGRTLSRIREYLFEQGAKSVEICTFLDKPSRRIVNIEAKYTGFEIPDEFVIGYGLDYAYKYRQYPFVGVLKPEYYE